MAGERHLEARMEDEDKDEDEDEDEEEEEEEEEDFGACTIPCGSRETAP